MAETLLILLDFTLRATVLGVAAVALLGLWRASSAASRHAAWAGVVVGMLSLPLLTALAPRLPFAVPGMDAWTPAPESLSQRLVDIAPATLESTEAAPKTLANGSVTASPAPRREASREPWWPSALVALYLGIATLMLASLGRGVLLIRRLSHSARPIKDSTLQSMAVELLPGRHVMLQSSGAIQVPLTAGLMHPRVFLPESWSTWSRAKCRAVLAHELAHVQRGDFLWTLLAEINKCLYWFHPLAWIARRRLVEAAEEASDVAAVEALGSKTAYARTLVEIAALLRGRPHRLAPAIVPMAARSGLSQRVEQILNLPVNRRRSWRQVAAVAAVLTGMVLFTGSVDLTAAPPDPVQLDGTVASVEGWIRELGSPDPDRRGRAAYELALDESYFERAIPHLIALLGDDEPLSDRPQARRSRHPGDRWIPAYLSWHQPSPGEVAVVSLAAMSSLATEPLIDALEHGDPTVRRNAAWGLGELRGRPGVPNHGEIALIAALNDPDASVRAAAAWSLGDIRVRSAIPSLIETLRDDPDDRTRAMAANALGEIRAADAEDLLAQTAAQDPAQRVRRESRRALREVIEHGY